MITNHATTPPDTPTPRIRIPLQIQRLFQQFRLDGHKGSDSAHRQRYGQLARCGSSKNPHAFPLHAMLRIRILLLLYIPLIDSVNSLFLEIISHRLLNQGAYLCLKLQEEIGIWSASI